jgi:hypothetical protein
VSNWDEDSERLQWNLGDVLRAAREQAVRRWTPSLFMASRWHIAMMKRLTVPNAEYVGKFRGNPGLECVGVRVEGVFGTHPSRVAAELRDFEYRLQEVVAALDERYAPSAVLDPDGVSAVIHVAAWAHSEWVRIHPFANGNGRTARLWSNFIFMRYGLPPLVRGRPRPEGDYASACERAMFGDWEAMVPVFIEMAAAVVNEGVASTMSADQPPSP